MMNRETEPITQKQLIDELYKRGLVDINERRIVDWRQKGLLPSFDVTGGSNGKSHGRRCSSWSDGEFIITQALWIRWLLSIYGDSRRIYLPLMLIGGSVRLSDIRSALTEPLQNSIDSINAEVEAQGDLEDAIGDSAFDFIRKSRKSDTGSLQLPQETLEAFMNVLLNGDYNLEDVPFEEGVQGFQNWRQEFHQTLVSNLSNVSATNSTPAKGQTDGLDFLFSNASFFKEYLSVPALKTAVDECSDDDMLVVIRDIHRLQKVALSISSMLGLLMKDMPEDFRRSWPRILPAIFKLGTWIVLADLSLRRNGFSQIIDQFLDQFMSNLIKELNEKLKIEVSNASQLFAAAFEAITQEVIKLLTETNGQTIKPK
jgi:hypothetical protein